MASRDPLLNMRLRMLDDDDNNEPEEFAKLDAIFNSQETSEEIKTNVFALKQKFRKLQLSYASHVHISRQDSETKALEMDNLMEKQQHLEDDVRAAHKYMQQLQDINTKLEMKMSMGNESLWHDLETLNKLHHTTKMELATTSKLVRDYHVYSANILARNAYLEDKCKRLLEQLGNADGAGSLEKQESDWQIFQLESTSIIDQTIAELTEATPSTSTDISTGLKENDEKNLEIQIIELNATIAENEEELNSLKNKLRESSNLPTENENLLVNISNLTKSGQFLESYNEEKIKATIPIIDGVDHLILDKLVTFHNKSKSESDLMSKQSLEKDKGTAMPSSLTNIQLRRSITHIARECFTHIHNGPTEGRSLLEKSPSSLVPTLTEENRSGTDNKTSDKYHVIESQLTEANKKITELTTECQHLTEDIGELKSNKSTLEKLNWSLDNRVEFLFKEKEKAIREVETLKKKLTIWEKTSQPNDTHINVPREEYDVLLNNYNKIRAGLTAKISQQQSAQRDIAEEKSKPSMARKDDSKAMTSTEVSNVQSTPVEENTRTIQISGEGINTKVELELLNQKLRRIEEELRDSKKEENSLLREKETFIKMLQDSFNSKENAQSQIILLNNEIQTLRSKISGFEEQANTAKDNYEREKENSQVVQSDLRKEQQCLEEKLHDSLSERNMLLETITECNRKLKILADANDALDDTKRRLEAEKDRIETEYNVLHSENISLKEKIHQENEKSLCVEDHQRLLNKMNDLVTELTFERDQLKVTIDDCSIKIKSFEDHNNDLQMQKDMLELKLHDIDSEKLLLQTTLQSTEDNLMMEKTAHSKCLKSLESETQQLFYQLSLENTLLRSENKVLCTEIKHQVELIGKEVTMVDKYKKQLTWQQNVINNQGIRIKTLKAECMEKDELQSELEYVECDIQIYLERINGLNRSLNEAQNTDRKYQAENSDIKSKLYDAEVKLNETLSNQNRMKDLVEEMKNKIEDFERAIIGSVQRLDYVQDTFVRTTSSMSDEEEPNLADALSAIRTNLVNAINKTGEPMTTKFGTNISELLANLQQKENELARVKEHVEELNTKYTAVFKELQTMRSQPKPRATPRECAKCVKLSNRICELVSHIDDMAANGITDDTLASYKNHCDYLTKKIDLLEKEKQKLHAHQSQVSEPQYTTDLENELLALKNKYKKLKTVARTRLIEIQELKSRLGYDPYDAQGRSTDP